MRATTARAWRVGRRRDLPLVLRAHVALLAVDLGVRGAGLVPVWDRIRRRVRPPRADGGPDAAELTRLRRAVASAARNHLYPMRCLPQALALAWLLARRGVAVELRIGARRLGGEFQAHAWLERDGAPLFPEPEPETPFRPLEPGPGMPSAGTYRGEGPGRQTAELYGLCVHSDLPLPGGPAAGREPDVELVRAAPGEAPPFEPGPESCVYRNADGPAPGPGVMEVHRRGPWYGLRCTGFADFYFTDGRRVTYASAPGVPPEAVVALFAGPVCAVLMELRGRPCLHAGAVRVGRAAVALAGHSGTGKSTLTAALVDAGHPLVSDDIVPLLIGCGECRAVPGYPGMKLDAGDGRPGPAGPWPAVVPGSAKGAVPVGRGWGEFVTNPTPLAAVYILDRDPDPAADVRVEPLTPAEGLMELVRFSFCARLVERLGLQPQRLALLAGAVRQVRVCRLRFPTGLEHLGRVRAAIVGDVTDTLP